MAWSYGNRKWYLPFTSLNGTSCYVNIYKRGYTGSTYTTLTGADNPISYEEEDDEDLLKVIRIKTGYIRVVEESYGALIDLNPSNDMDHYVEFYYGNVLYFNGFMQAQAFQNDWTAPPHVLQFPIQSPLALCENLKFSQKTPGTDYNVTAIFTEILNGFNAAYTRVVKPSSDTSFRLEAVQLCQFASDPTESDGSDAYEPITYKDFLEAYCNMFGLIIHDTPTQLIFSRFDYTGAYDNANISGGTSYNFDTYYSNNSDEGEEGLVRPLGKIKVSYSGNRKTDAQSINLQHSAYIKKQEADMSVIAWMLPVTPEVSSNHMLNTSQMGIGSNTNLPTTKGVAIASAGSSSGITNDGILIYYHSSWTPVSTNKILDLNFYNFPLPRNGATLKFSIEAVVADYLYSLPSSGDDANILLAFSINGEYYSTSDYRWDHSLSDTNVKKTMTDMTNGFWLRNVPYGACLTVSVYASDSTPDGALMLIKSATLSVTEREKWIVKYEDKLERTISSTNGSPEEGSIDMGFNIDKLSTNSVIEPWDKVYTPPSYPYLFVSQNRVKLKAKSITAFGVPYLPKWNFWISGYKWRIIAISFEPWNDEYTITLHRSSTIE